MEEERKRKEAEQRLQEEAARLLNLLPEEPDAKCGKPVSRHVVNGYTTFGDSETGLSK